MVAPILVVVVTIAVALLVAPAPPPTQVTVMGATSVSPANVSVKLPPVIAEGPRLAIVTV